MLNSFRFCAAMGVLIQHVEEVKKHLNWIHLFDYDAVRFLGNVCVTGFFVLSGFLITYLLFHEKKQTENIQIFSFYWRRIVRIWPLYYFSVFLYKIILVRLPLESKHLIYTNSSFAIETVIPFVEISTTMEWILLLCLLPQLLIAFGKIFFPFHLWSIGVEEFFYVFWPVFIKKCQQYRRAFIFVIAGYMLLSLGVFAIWLILKKTGSNYTNHFQAGIFFMYSQRISCMAIGALGAEALFFKRHEMLAFIMQKKMLVIAPLLLFTMTLSGILFPVIIPEIYSILFIIIIIQIIHLPERFQSNPLYRTTEKLGTYSYGIYMYHPFCIVLAFEVLRKMQFSNTIFSNYFIVYAVTCCITWSIAFLSFRFFETPILRLKNLKFRREETRVSVHSS